MFSVKYCNKKHYVISFRCLLYAITDILVHSATTYIDTSLKVISVKSKQALVGEINGLPS